MMVLTRRKGWKYSSNGDVSWTELVRRVAFSRDTSREFLGAVGERLWRRPATRNARKWSIIVPL
jgi:hypothetical protein